MTAAIRHLRSQHIPQACQHAYACSSGPLACPNTTDCIRCMCVSHTEPLGTATSSTPGPDFINTPHWQRWQLCATPTANTARWRRTSRLGDAYGSTELVHKKAVLTHLELAREVAACRGVAWCLREGLVDVLLLVLGVFTACGHGHLGLLRGRRAELVIIL